MILALAALLTAGAIVYTLLVRARDLPAPAPPSPFQHLDERKAVLYENLRDLQFELRLGKLSDADYELAKAGLQMELAAVMAEIDRLKEEPALAPAPDPDRCPHCGARFPQPLKFCGECGKPMAGGAP